MILLVLALTAVAAVTAVVGLLRGSGTRPWSAVIAALTALALALEWFDTGHDWSTGQQHLLTAFAGILAVAGGGLVTSTVFSLVDSRDEVDRAGEVLRGGAWIGALERVAVFATLVVGWGAGIAVVLAVKGLGRYPELRNEQNTGAAERFIIGTFTSVLWAAACAGLAALTT
jgi:F0F1-type ATP synthase membrane subunit c/vacuolar-type H+-ATPase subunit K